MTRERFDVRCLEKYQFVDYVIQYLKENNALLIKSNKVERHLKLLTGTVFENRKETKIACVGYGGSGSDLRALPTPLQTELLPFVFHFWNNVSDGDKSVPLLIMGHSFDEVFLRKMRLLGTAIPDLRLIQYINVLNLSYLEERINRMKEHNQKMVNEKKKIKCEVMDFQAAIIEHLVKDGRIGQEKYHVVDCEMPAGEGTKKAEVIDILALEVRRKWLNVIEVKFEKLNKPRTQGVIFQGLDYCNWVEEHKKGLAMIFPDRKVDTRRRTRLLVINGPDGFPGFHKDVVNACVKKDRYQEIELYFTGNKLPLEFKRFK
jgi:hypothetical protein